MEFWQIVNDRMIHPQTIISSVCQKIQYVPLQVIVLILLLSISSCYPEDKNRQDASQRADSVRKQTSQGEKDSSSAGLVFPGTDTFQQGCEMLQDQAEALLEEYHRQGTTNLRLKQIIPELEKLDQQWQARDCQQVFGFIIPKVPRQPHSTRKNESDTINPSSN
jgi:hypothetical protein